VTDIKFRSSLLNSIFDCLPLILEDVVTLKSMLDITAVERGNDVTNVFQSDEPWPEISEYKMVSILSSTDFQEIAYSYVVRQKIKETEQEFQEHLQELRKILRNSTTQYVTVAGIEVSLLAIEK
jgi:hypothetical protein